MPHFNPTKLLSCLKGFVRFRWWKNPLLRWSIEKRYLQIPWVSTYITNIFYALYILIYLCFFFPTIAVFDLPKFKKWGIEQIANANLAYWHNQIALDYTTLIRYLDTFLHYWTKLDSIVGIFHAKRAGLKRTEYRIKLT